MPLDCSDEDFALVVRTTMSLAGAVRALGRAVVGSNYRLVKREVVRRGLDTSHWVPVKWSRKDKLASAAVLVEDSAVSTKRAKIIVLRERLIPYRCDMCGCGPEWNGRPLVLRLDHRNGRRSDHRPENLRFLCPNCDSQTETFCGRNKRLAPVA